MPSQLFKHADTSAQRADVNAHTLRVLLGSLVRAVWVAG